MGKELIPYGNGDDMSKNALDLEFVLGVCDTIGRIIYESGEKPNVSTGICGRLTYGYGYLDHNGYWQFPVYLNEEERS